MMIGGPSLKDTIIIIEDVVIDDDWWVKFNRNYHHN